MRKLVVTLMVLSAFASGCTTKPKWPVPPGANIVGSEVSFSPGAPQLGALGVERAGGATATAEQLFGRLVWNDDATVRVFTPFAGRVRRVLVDVGQVVERGTPLAEVDSPDFGQAQADARTAESDLQLAESNLARLTELLDHGAAARKDLEAAEAERAKARAQRARALATLAACGGSADSVTGLFVLRSPIAGTVVERNLTPGQEIRPDQMLANAPSLCSPLLVLSDPSRLWVQVDAPEAQVGALRPGATFRFSSTALPGRSFGGHIDVVSESIDPATRTFRARGTVSNPGRLLKAEMYVAVEIPRETLGAASVPARAVFLKGDRHYVFVERKPNTFARQEVRVGDEQDSRVDVTAGLKAGERVVTDGSVLLEQILDEENGGS